MDHTAGYYAAIALLMALHHRARTGEGQHVDMSQIETGMVLGAVPILDAQVNGRSYEPIGNRSRYPGIAPQTRKRCTGARNRCTCLGALCGGLKRTWTIRIGRTAISGGEGQPATGDPLVVSAFGIKTVDGRDLIAHITVLVPAGQTPAQATGHALSAVGARPLQSSEFSLTGLKWEMSGSPATASPVQRYNGTNDPTGWLGNELNQIFGLWSGASPAFEITLAGVGLACPSLIEECGDQTTDGHNDIAWGDLKGGGTLGVTWFDTVGLEADVMLNTKFQWTLDLAAEGRGDGCRGPSSRCTVFDAFTVMLHEEGHMVGAGHSNVNGAVMEAVYEGARRSLHDDDIAAVVALYEGTTNGGGGGEVTDVHVEAVDHSRHGGRQGDKNLVVAVLVQDGHDRH